MGFSVRVLMTVSKIFRMSTEDDAGRSIAGLKEKRIHICNKCLPPQRANPCPLHGGRVLALPVCHKMAGWSLLVYGPLHWGPELVPDVRMWGAQQPDQPC